MARQWAGRTFGNGWMHRHLISVLRYVDVRLVYLFADIFIIPFCLIFNRSRRTSYSYFRERQEYGRLKAAWNVYVNHCDFVQVVVDRFAMYAGKHFDIEVVGRDRFDALAAGNEGFLHLSSHVGNYEIAGYSLVSDRKVINAVVFADEKESVMQNRESMFGRTNIHMISLKEDMSHLFEIDSALCKGDIVSFPADRHVSGGKVLECGFLGKDAKFPKGPFSVATMRDLNVLAVNAMKDGWKRYRIFVTPLEYDRNAPRKEQVSQLLSTYVAELERMLRLYPTQWYNFFDFWS